MLFWSYSIFEIINMNINMKYEKFIILIFYLDILNIISIYFYSIRFDSKKIKLNLSLVSK